MDACIPIDRGPPSATERVARLRLHFREVPLAELDEAELLVVDRNANEVREGRRFEATWNEALKQGHDQM